METKYYRCIRDLVHYRYKGSIYNIRAGQVVPYTPIVQNNLLNFEYFGDGFKAEKLPKEPPLLKDEETEEREPVKEVPKQVEKTEPVKEKPKKTVKRISKKKVEDVEVKIEVAEADVKEKKPTVKKRGRPKKVKKTEE